MVPQPILIFFVKVIFAARLGKSKDNTPQGLEKVKYGIKPKYIALLYITVKINFDHG